MFHYVVRWHEKRRRHKRLMHAALGEVSLAETLKTVDAMKGWEHMQTAIKLVVRCGCPRYAWPDLVATYIPIDGQGN